MTFLPFFAQGGIGGSSVFKVLDAERAFGTTFTDSDGPYAALAYLFATIAGGVAAWGIISRWKAAKRDDEKSDALLFGVLIVVFMYLTPTLLLTVARQCDALQTNLKMSPVYVAGRCMELSTRSGFSSSDRILNFYQHQKVVDAQTDAAKVQDDAAISKDLDRFGNGKWGIFVATLKQVGREVGNALSPSLLIEALSWLGKLLMTLPGLLLQMILTLALGVLMQVWMWVIMVVVFMMELVQYFTVYFCRLFVPLAVALYAFPGDAGGFKGPGRKFLVTSFSVAMWPIAWIVGNLGTVAIFTSIVSLPSNMSLGMYQNLEWDSNLPAPTAAEMTEASLNALQALPTAILYFVIGIAVLAMWTIYACTKLPFAFTSLMVDGVEMVSAAAMSAGSGVGSTAGGAMQSYANEAKAGAIASAVQAGAGAAIPALGAGMAAMGAIGGMLGGQGLAPAMQALSAAQGGGSMLREFTDMQADQRAAVASEKLADVLAQTLSDRGSPGRN